MTTQPTLGPAATAIAYAVILPAVLLMLAAVLLAFVLVLAWKIATLPIAAAWPVISGWRRFVAAGLERERRDAEWRAGL